MGTFLVKPLNAGPQNSELDADFQPELDAGSSAGSRSPGLKLGSFSDAASTKESQEHPTEGLVMLALKSPKERNFLLKLESWRPWIAYECGEVTARMDLETTCGVCMSAVHNLCIGCGPIHPGPVVCIQMLSRNVLITARDDETRPHHQQLAKWDVADLAELHPARSDLS